MRVSTVLALLSLVLLLAACQPAEVANSVAVQPLPTTVPPTATAVRPPVVEIQAATHTPAPSPQAFALATATTEGGSGMAVATKAPADAKDDVSPTPELPPTETVTPQPTFTPPSLPFTLAEDHFWFRRPVAEGGVVWTNKIYPYGSTRGGELRPHHGVEFDVDYDTEILAVASGTVVAAGRDDTVIFGPEPNFYGILVVVELDSQLNRQPVYTLYGHLNSTAVNVGQRVDVYDLIGLSGATGVADGPHMHFEVRVGSNDYNSTRNPLLWFYPFPDRGVIAGRVRWPDGTLAAEVPLTLRRLDAPSNYAATTTYTGDGVNADEVLQENFAFDDVVAGYYEIEIKLSESKKITEEVWVFPYRTSTVEMMLESP